VGAADGSAAGVERLSSVSAACTQAAERASTQAIAVNIEVMRTFVRVRAMTATRGDLAKR
jgi:hypothetical protein